MWHSRPGPQEPRPVAAPPTRHTGAASRGSSTSERPGGAMVWTWGFLGTKVPHLSWRGSQPSSQPGREKEGLPGQPLSTLECLFPLQRGHRTVTVQGSARGGLLIHRPCPLFCPTLTRPVDTQAELLGGWCAAPESGARLGPGAGEPPAVSSSEAGGGATWGRSWGICSAAQGVRPPAMLLLDLE